MKERPILVSTPLIRPILTDLKVHTRRLIRLPEGYDLAQNATVSHRHGIWWEVRCEPWATVVVRCPFGVPGDRLWVRETWRSVGWRPENGHWIEYAADNAKVWREAPEDVLSVDVYNHAHPDRWRPSIHMPRWASRISLEVTEIRVQRIQDITEEDARAEGLPRNWTDGEPGWNPDEHGYLTPAGCYADESGDDSPECWVWWKGRREVGVVYTAREAFQLWWGYINGERAGGSWEANPWVWVVAFKRVAGVAS